MKSHSKLPVFVLCFHLRLAKARTYEISMQKRKGSSEEATAAEWNKIFASYVSNKNVLQFQKLKKIYYENGWSNPTRVAFGFSKIAKDLHSVSSPQHTNIQKMGKPRYGSELDF